MNFFKKLFSELLDELKQLLLTVAIIAAIALAIFFAIQAEPDTVTIKYVEDGATHSTVGFTRIVSSQDSDVIEEWFDFVEEAAPKEKFTAFQAYSAAFPCYIIEFRENSKLVSWLMVTTKEVVFSSDLRTMNYIGYVPKNSFYEQAGERMAIMETIGK